MRQGGMEGAREPRLVSPDDKEWWTVLEEEYWQAVLAQGESPLETVPPLNPQEVFRVLDIETNNDIDLPTPADAAAEPGQEWEVAVQAMESGKKFSLEVLGANRCWWIGTVYRVLSPHRT
jgi:hypothetical protein